MKRLIAALFALACLFAPSLALAQSDVVGSNSVYDVRRQFGSDRTDGTAPGVAQYDQNGAVLRHCNASAIYDASTSGSTELVALTAGKTIYVCGYSILAAGTVNVKLIYGTGSACATGATNMTPAYQLVAQAGIVDGSPIYRGLKTAASNALCINTSAGIAVQAIVYYSKD